MVKVLKIGLHITILFASYVQFVKHISPLSFLVTTFTFKIVFLYLVSFLFISRPHEFTHPEY